MKRYDNMSFFIVAVFIIMLIFLPKEKGAAEPPTEENLIKETYYIEDTLPHEEQDFLYKLCKENDIDYTLAMAIIWQESNFNPTVISETDDWGLMQINTINHPYYEENFGITDFLDPYQNMTVGVDILSKCMQEFNNKNFAILAYNQGIYGTYTLIEDDIYTIDYVEQVLTKENALIEKSQREELAN